MWENIDLTYMATPGVIKLFKGDKTEIKRAVVSLMEQVTLDEFKPADALDSHRSLHINGIKITAMLIRNESSYLCVLATKEDADKVAEGGLESLRNISDGQHRI